VELLPRLAKLCFSDRLAFILIIRLVNELKLRLRRLAALAQFSPVAAATASVWETAAGEAAVEWYGGD